MVPAITDWIDQCDNALYSALTFQGAAAWRAQLQEDVKDPAALKLIEDIDVDVAEFLGDLRSGAHGDTTPWTEIVRQRASINAGNETVIRR